MFGIKCMISLSGETLLFELWKMFLEVNWVLTGYSDKWHLVSCLIEIGKNILHIMSYDFTYKQVLVIPERDRWNYAETNDQQRQQDQHCWRFWAVILQWALSKRIMSS